MLVNSSRQFPAAGKVSCIQPVLGEGGLSYLIITVCTRP